MSDSKLNLLSFSGKTRILHLSWFAFFLCFFAWFGIAPLMAVVRDELGLTKTQVGNTIIAGNRLSKYRSTSPETIQ